MQARIDYMRGLRNGELYAFLLSQIQPGDRLLVKLSRATGVEECDVTDRAAFDTVDDAFRSGRFINRTFWKDIDVWREGVQARHFKADGVREIMIGQSLPKLHRDEQVWAKCADGVVRCVALYDPSLIGQFQSNAEPVTEYAPVVDEE